MKKVAVVLAVLCLIGVVRANVAVTVDSAATWYGYMNVFETPANGGTYCWGSSWGTADLAASFNSAGVLSLSPNTNCWSASDSYWVNQTTGLGNKTMEANFYQEFSGLAGQTVTFTYTVLADTLSSDYAAQAFIKVFDSSWGFIQSLYVDLSVGTHTITLDVSSSAAMTQVGFLLKGLVVDPASDAAATSVTIVPEPTTMLLLGIGGLLLGRKKQD